MATDKGITRIRQVPPHRPSLAASHKSVTYDLKDAAYQQITILDRASTEPFANVMRIGHRTKPLQVMPIAEPERIHYRPSSSYPRCDGVFIEDSKVSPSSVIQATKSWAWPSSATTSARHS